MDLNPLVPQDPQGGTPSTPPTPPAQTPAAPVVPPAPPPPPAAVPNPEVGGVDLSKILLPKKDAPGKTLDSAQRINAGALLESEQNAVLPKPEPAASPVVPTPAAPKPDTAIKPIETYQGDIEKLVANKNVSVVSIASAEAARRSAASLGQTPPSPPFDFKVILRRSSMVGGGIILLAAAAGLILYVLQPAPSVQIPIAEASPFINVDATKVLTIPPNNRLTHTDVINALNGERKGASLSLGLIERLYIAESSTTSDGKETLNSLTAQTVLRFLSPSVPDTLARSVDPKEFVLGIHIYEENQPLLILKADSYEQAYSGMLEWEPRMQSDLAPLFTRTPRLQLSSATTDATTTATSTATSTQPQYVPPPVFVDRIVENHDARVIQNDAGDILLLWTFIDRKTLVVTTNEVTLREIITRLKNAPVVPLP